MSVCADGCVHGSLNALLEWHILARSLLIECKGFARDLLLGPEPFSIVAIEGNVSVHSVIWNAPRSSWNMHLSHNDYRKNIYIHI